MIECKQIEYQESKICVLTNDLSSKELLSFFENKDLYKNELKSISTEHKKKDFISVRYALKKCMNGKEQVIYYTPKGKPFLYKNKNRISVSHTKNWVAVIIHKDRKVGIDIEKPRKTLIKVAKKFLSPTEFDFYNQLTKDEGFIFLRIVWSAKEALFKIVGDAYNFSEQLHALPFEINKEKGELKLIHTDTGKTYLMQYILTQNYTLTYCVDNE
ncbi:MAG: hypothetical protein CR965_00320 [Paludibacter sp.]|nr:MAG: hypothetical protein CR965_00320 [Paludibacter sp.]